MRAPFHRYSIPRRCNLLVRIDSWAAAAAGNLIDNIRTNHWARYPANGYFRQSVDKRKMYLSLSLCSREAFLAGCPQKGSGGDFANIKKKKSINFLFAPFAHSPPGRYMREN